MIKLYYTLVKAGIRAIENVPIEFRADVQALLDAK
jgi:hypothetical protein